MWQWLRFLLAGEVAIVSGMYGAQILQAVSPEPHSPNT